jgi:hypothetical protein
VGVAEAIGIAMVVGVRVADAADGGVAVRVAVRVAVAAGPAHVSRALRELGRDTVKVDAQLTVSWSPPASAIVCDAARSKVGLLNMAMTVTTARTSTAIEIFKDRFMGLDSPGSRRPGATDTETPRHAPSRSGYFARALSAL